MHLNAELRTSGGGGGGGGGGSGHMSLPACAAASFVCLPFHRNNGREERMQISRRRVKCPRAEYPQPDLGSRHPLYAPPPKCIALKWYMCNADMAGIEDVSGTVNLSLEEGSCRIGYFAYLGIDSFGTEQYRSHLTSFRPAVLCLIV